MKRLVVLSGAGMSAESGLTTFRDSGGLWEQYDIMEVASIEGWHRNPGLVLEFYNQRRRQLYEVEPNSGHLLLAELQSSYDVRIVTQNVDDLHERAGSQHVLHLHGQLRSATNASKTWRTEWYDDITLESKTPFGEQMRPDIVWFGEHVYLMDEAIEIVSAADVLIVVGTSLQVYPAASLIYHAPKGAQCYVIDPKVNEYDIPTHFVAIAEPATSGLRHWRELYGE